MIGKHTLLVLSKLINGVAIRNIFMSNFKSFSLKSKFLLGVMVVAVMVVGLAVDVNQAAAADCTITTTLKVGSKGDEVKCLQTAVGVKADGSFGPKTKAAVMAWQKTAGLTADGVFGAKSRAAFAGRPRARPRSLRAWRRA